MSTSLVAIAVVVGIGLILGLFYISHTIEKQKAKRALMIGNLSERAHLLQRLLENVPPAYIPKDLKLLILKEIKVRYEKLAALAPGNGKFQKQLNGTLDQISQTQNSNESPPTPRFSTPKEAAEIKSALQSLSKAVEAFVKSGSLPAAAGQQHLHNIQRSFVEANVNYLVAQGDLARREGKEKVAVLNYQKAINELSKRNQDKRYSARIEQIKATLAALGPEEQAPRQEGSELTQGVKDLIEEDNSWKKKYF